jgi:transmembrane sensor
LPQIATLSLGEIDRVLAWQHRLLEFDATPLAEVVAEFNRRNVVQLRVIDPEIAALRISGTFRTDNIELLVNFMQQGPFGVRVDRHGDTEIELRRVGGHGP